MVTELKVGPKKFSLDRTIIMGVLNVTPDSFSDGGLYVHPEKALARANQMVDEGCDILDIGGESTRPYSSPVSADEELRRVMPVIKETKNLNVPISIDTCKPEVARWALENGAHMVNDISGLREDEMVRLVADKEVPVVIMHMKGSPKTMQKDPEYEDVVKEVKEFLEDAAKKAIEEGVKSDKIIIDPGIGFGKKMEHNLEILKRLDEFKNLGFPILVGTSRKSFIGTILGLDVDERLEGSLAAMGVAIMNGADIVRIHDVKESVRATKLVDAIKSA